MNAPVPTLDVLGVPLVQLSPEEALAAIVRLYDSGSPAVVAHANVHTVNLAGDDPSYRDVLSRFALVLNDGKGVLLAGRILGQPFPADLNGNFFTPLVLREAAARGWTVFLLGAEPGVADRLASRLGETYPGLKVVGTHDGFFSEEQAPAVAAAIRDSGAGLVLAGMGNPRQERWLDRWLPESGARVGVGVGAFFDFSAGTIPRAPAWMNKIGLEWVHRLFQDPKRMWRRYLVGNPRFVSRVLKARRRARVPSRPK